MSRAQNRVVVEGVTPEWRHVLRIVALQRNTTMSRLILDAVAAAHPELASLEVNNEASRNDAPVATSINSN